MFNLLLRQFWRLQYKLLIIQIFQKKLPVDEKNNLKQNKFMKSIYKKIIFIISAIALFSVIVVVVKYSLTYIKNNPEKYLPTQKQDKN